MDSYIDFSDFITCHTEDFIGREWVFRNIDNWLQQKDGSRIFLLISEPGDGKTAIAARLCQFSHTSDVTSAPAECSKLAKGFLSAIHFCSFQDPLWTDPQVFAGSLSLQLAESVPSFGKHLLDRNRDRQISLSIDLNIGQMTGGQATGISIQSLNLGGSTPEEAFNRLVREPLEAALRSGHEKQVVILVDGLDEALAYSGTMGIAPLITQMAGLPPTVRLILTSSPGPIVEKLLRQPGITSCYLTGELGLQQSLEDIQQYVIQSLASRPNLVERLAPNLEQKDLVAAIQRKSEGNFLYVCQLLKMLDDQRLDGKIDATSLKTLPDGLANFYVQELEHRVGTIGVGENRYAALLGTLAVAREGLPEAQLSSFTGQSETVLRAALVTLRPFLNVDESLPPSQRIYSLYHHSFVTFLMNADQAGLFWCAPREQHQRIVNYYYGRDGWKRVPWAKCDTYGLRHLVGHLQSLLAQARDWREDDEFARSLYTLVLTPAFRQAQQNRLKHELPPDIDPSEIPLTMAQALLSLRTGGSGVAKTRVGMAVVQVKGQSAMDPYGTRDIFVQTLTFFRSPTIDIALVNLRTTIEIALAHSDWRPALECMSAYLMPSQSKTRIGDIFKAVDDRDISTALKSAASYQTATGQARRWTRAFMLYLAWEAAVHGQAELTGQAIVAAKQMPEAPNNTLCHGLLIRAAQALVTEHGSPPDVEAYLATWEESEAAAVLPQLDLSRPLDPAEKIQARQWLDQLHDQLINLSAESDDTTVWIDLRDDWTQIWQEWTSVVRAIAADPVGQEAMELLLRTALSTPEPTFRELALFSLATVNLFAPSQEILRRYLRTILAQELDGLGPAFDFDLPAFLLGEAQRRKLPTPELTAWFDRALASEDPWGTALRARGAYATMLSLQGQTADACRELIEAFGTSPGCAPYAAVHFLSLINQWYESGSPDLDWATNTQTGELLCDAALLRAYRVRDADMRQSCAKLVNAYCDWLVEGTPDLETVQAKLPTFTSSNTATTYMDFVVARWSRLPQFNSAENWRALVSLALVAQVSPYPALMRLLTSSIHQISNEELSDLISIYTASLTDLPTEIGLVSYPPLESPEKLPNLLLNMGNFCRERKDFDAAQNLLDHGLDLCDRTENPNGIAISLALLGQVAEARQRYVEASELYQQSILIYRSLGDEWNEGWGEWAMGRATALQYHYTEAAQHYREGHSILARVGEEVDLAGAIHGLGTLAEQHRDFEIAQGFYQQSAKMYEVQSNMQGLSTCLNQLGRIAEEEKDYDRARDFYRRSLALAYQSDAESEIATALYNLGHVADLQKDFREARQRYQESLALDEKLGNHELARTTRQRLDEIINCLVQKDVEKNCRNESKES